MQMISGVRFSGGSFDMNYSRAMGDALDNLLAAFKQVGVDRNHYNRLIPRDGRFQKEIHIYVDQDKMAEAKPKIEQAFQIMGLRDVELPMTYNPGQTATYKADANGVVFKIISESSNGGAA